MLILSISSLFIFRHSSRCDVVSHSSLHFPMTTVNWCPFLLLIRCLFVSFAHFKLGHLPSYCRAVRVLCIFWYNSFIIQVHSEYFFPVCDLTFKEKFCCFVFSAHLRSSKACSEGWLSKSQNLSSTVYAIIWTRLLSVSSVKYLHTISLMSTKYCLEEHKGP